MDCYWRDFFVWTSEDDGMAGKRKPPGKTGTLHSALYRLFEVLSLYPIMCTRYQLIDWLICLFFQVVRISTGIGSKTRRRRGLPWMLDDFGAQKTNTTRDPEAKAAVKRISHFDEKVIGKHTLGPALAKTPRERARQTFHTHTSTYSTPRLLQCTICSALINIHDRQTQLDSAPMQNLCIN